METSEKRESEAVDAEAEDIPSDFFDDFNKDEFMEGLSVIDSWDEEEGKKRHSSRINVEALDSVKDLRELIREGKDDDSSQKKKESFVRFNTRFKWVRKPEESPHQRRSSSGSRLDEYIKPGSRRDPCKTNAAIKKDKEVKVKEYLAKHLEDDLRPPGTELDDYFGEAKPVVRKLSPFEEKSSKHSYDDSWESKVPRNREPPYREPHFRGRRSPRFYHQRKPGWVQRRSPMRSPRRYSPHREVRRRHSPPQLHRRSPRRHSPPMMRRSPHRYSPHRGRRSRSPLPYRHSYHTKRSRSHSPSDNFLYPKESGPSTSYPPTDSSYETRPVQYNAPAPAEYPVVTPGYTQEPSYSQESVYPQVPGYGGAFSGPYDYGGQPVAHVPVPQPVPAPVLNPMPVHDLNPNAPMINSAEMIHSQALAPMLNSGQGSPMLPSPAPIVAQPPIHPQHNKMTASTPYDALAQLVAEGKLSKEDYLKLAPNKGATSFMDNKTRVMVLNRCTQAMGKLKNLVFPNRLLVNSSMVSQEQKCLPPKYCSPLKRQDAVEFQFTKADGSAVTQQNKQLIDRIVATLGLEKVIVKSMKKSSKNMKDAAVQTTQAFCEVCEIRDSMQTYDSSTSIDPGYFSTSIHTQVVEHDLVNSKSVFNPSGSSSDGAPISIAHMTPAQLVSQLAARAKSLKQPPDSAPASNQYGRWNASGNYDYDGRGGGGGGQQYKNNYNKYRY